MQSWLAEVWNSSSIAAIAQHLYRDGKTSVRPVGFTFSTAATPEEDERHYSLALRDELGLQMIEMPFPKALISWESSLHPGSMNIPALCIDTQWPEFMQAVRDQGCNIFMRGDGGDMLYRAASYRYVDDVRALRWGRVWPWVQAGRREGSSWVRLIWWFYVWPLLPLRLQYQVDRYRPRRSFGVTPAWLKPDLLRQARTAERLYCPVLPKRFDSPARQAQYEDLLNWLTQTIMTELYGGWGRQAGLEFREPYLDRRLVEFLLAAPLELGAKPGAAGRRWILREAMHGVLPEKIRTRKSKTFGSQTFNSPLLDRGNQDKITQLFSESRLESSALADVILLQSINESKVHTGGTGIFRAIFLELWLRAHSSLPVKIIFRELSKWQPCDYVVS